MGGLGPSWAWATRKYAAEQLERKERGAMVQCPAMESGEVIDESSYYSSRIAAAIGLHGQDGPAPPTSAAGPADCASSQPMYQPLDFSWRARYPCPLAGSVVLLAMQSAPSLASEPASQAAAMRASDGNVRPAEAAL